MLPKVAIILINYKNYAEKFLSRAYLSLQKINYPKDKYKIYIADNVTSIETQNIIKNLAPNAIVVPSNGNGWGHGNNICVKKACEDNFDDYFAFVNMDTIFEQNFLLEAINLIESDKTIGAVQSKLLLYPPTQTGEYNLNSKGNTFTFLGFGYCAGDGKKDDTAEMPFEITSCAGAGMIVPREIFFTVGMCDASYFMYHDDIELSQKIRIMGYKLYLAPKSIIYHQHEFARSIMLIYYIERNRLRFLLEFYKLPTLLLIFPAFVIMEFGMMIFVIKNKWFLIKIKSYLYFLNPKNILWIFKKRKFVQELRTISDKEFVSKFVAKIDFQQVDNPLLKYIANPMFDLYWRIIRKIIFW